MTTPAPVTFASDIALGTVLLPDDTAWKRLPLDLARLRGKCSARFLTKHADKLSSLELAFEQASKAVDVAVKIGIAKTTAQL